MGTESTSISVRVDGNQKNYQTQVFLNVYDLTPINNYTSWFGFGIFHSGIEGEQIHAYVVKLGLDSDAFVHTSLIHMYAQNGELGSAHLIFDKSSMRDAISFTALLTGYASKGLMDDARFVMKPFHGKEYGFGAHDFPASGVFEVEPRTCPGYTFRCRVPLGYFDMPLSEFRAYIENAASEYHGDTYNLISKNCNHFTDDISWRLTGKRIPGWVNRLARLGALCSCLLPESLQVTTVKHLPEYHEVSEDDGIESISTASPRGPMEMVDDQDKQLLSPTTESREVVFIQESHR